MVRYNAYGGVLPQSGLARILSESYTTPLGQLLLGTAIKQALPQTHVVIFDPTRTPQTELWEKILRLQRRYDKVLVGLSLLSGNTEHGFQLAQNCAQRGIDVVIGGPETTGYGAANIMSSRPYIRYGIDGLGERILPQLMLDTPLDEIAGLTFREQGEMKRNPANPLSTRLDWLNVGVDYGLLDNLQGNVGTTYLMGNDCFIAEKRCYFCGRLGMGNPQTQAEITARIGKVWSEIEYAWQAGLTHYFNSADSALRNPKLLRAFTDSMPDWFNPKFHHLFANAHELTDDVIPLLKKLHATVYLGVENAAIQNHGKGKIHFESEQSPDLMSSKRAIELLHHHNIPMRLSFVFGCPGETKDTLAKNLETIVDMVNRFPTIADLELNPIEVLPGTQAFHDLIKFKADKYHKKQVPYDTLEMSRDLVPLVSQVTRDQVLDWIGRMYQAVKSIKPIQINTKGISQEEFRQLVAVS